MIGKKARTYDKSLASHTVENRLMPSLRIADPVATRQDGLSDTHLGYKRGGSGEARQVNLGFEPRT